MNKSVNDLQIGDQYERLTVRELFRENKPKEKGTILKVRCDCICGNQITILASSLVRYHTRSCGCLQVEMSRRRFNDYFDISASWIRHTKDKAIKRGYVFEITIQDVWEVWEKQHRLCALTGQPLIWPKCTHYKSKHGREGTASIDRIDNTKGYIKGNIQIVHKYINIMKQRYSQNDFIDMCRKVAEYMDYRG
jgi:hypothetical protein